MQQAPKIRPLGLHQPGLVSPTPQARVAFFSGNILWISALLITMCFEGWARKTLSLPSLLLYVAKDAILLSALIFIGVKKDVLAVARALYGRWIVFLALAVLVTVIQLLNPNQPSWPLGLLGLRAYWLWWIFAPLLIASALRSAADRSRAVVVLAALAVVVAVYAGVQFASPRDAPINSYALYDGEVVMETAFVHTTGKTRVAGTFSFVAGFADFAVAAPILLLSMGLDSKARMRVVTISAAVVVAGSAAMSASRQSIILCAVGLVTILARAGFLASRSGRWAMLGIVLAVYFAMSQAGEAVEGVVDRFEGGDTWDRIERELSVLPPVAIAKFEHPVFGLGTGSQQSARFALGVPIAHNEYEEETPRIMVELGTVGYVIFWLARVGLIVALLRASRILKRQGQVGASGGAMALAAVTMFHRIVFDHVWQSFYFLGLGLVLSAVMDHVRAKKPIAQRR